MGFELLFGFELVFPEAPEVDGDVGVEVETGVVGVEGAEGEVAPTTTASRVRAIGTGANEARLLVDPVVDVIIPKTTGVALVTVVVNVTFFTGSVFATTTAAGSLGAAGAGPGFGAPAALSVSVPAA